MALGAVSGLILRYGADPPGQVSSGAALDKSLVDALLVCPLPCLVGIDGCALAMGRQMDFWSGYTGAAAGAGVAIGVGAILGYSRQLETNPLARVLPAVAAGVLGTIAYNAVDFNSDYASREQRFTGPTLAYFGPDESGGTAVDFDLRVLTVRF